MSAWRGVIETYRLEIYLKGEGFNPTGSFQTVVPTLPGHGLKDPDTALESASRPTTVPADLGAVLAQLGL